MEKTSFAGLTILDPDDSLFEDGGAFTSKDRRLIDRFLQFGAKTHRHTGLGGLENPDTEMGASAVASAGQIPAGVEFSVGYTLETDDGGETILSPTIILATEDPIETPTSAPALEMVYGSGSLLTDTYYYAYSYTDGEGGETPVGPVAGVEREPGFSGAQVEITDLLGDGALSGAGATGWRLYRAVGGGDLHFLASGTADAYTDDGSESVDCDIRPLPVGTNTTNNNNSIIFELPPDSDPKVASAAFINVYASPGGSFEGDVLVDQFPVASAGNTTSYDSIDFLDGSPPSVNTAVGHPNKIDPDSEILDWHWLRPVADRATLQETEGEEGDVRATLDGGEVWIHHDGEWVRVNDLLIVRETGSALPAKSLELIGSGGIGIITSDQGSGAIQVEINGSGLSQASGLVGEVLDDTTGSVEEASRLRFAGSGIASAQVTDEGGGLAEILITVPPGTGGDGSIEEVLDDDTGSVSDPTKLKFVGSGGASAEVTDEGSGLAQVLITAPHASEGGDGGSIEEVFDDEGGSVLDPSKIKFIGSAGASATVEDGGSGEAHVTISASGVAGIDGEDGRTVLNGEGAPDSGLGVDGDFYIDTLNDEIYGPKESGSWGSPTSLVGPAGGTVDSIVFDDQETSVEALHVTLLGSGGAAVVLEDDGSGSATMTVHAAASGDTGGGGGAGGSREWITDTTVSLAPDASATHDLTAYAGQRIIGAQTDRPASVRVYGLESSREDDAGRSVGVEPSEPVEVLMDLVTAGSAFYVISPAVDAHNLDDPPEGKLYLSVHNLDDVTSTVDVELLLQKTEDA